MKFYLHNLIKSFSRDPLRCALILVLAFTQGQLIAQEPVITAQFANPLYDCETEEYCLDVEFQSDTMGREVFGMNVRFFYEDSALEIIDFRDFQGGYGPFAPNPPINSQSSSFGTALGFETSAADFINGAMQLTNPTATPIELSDTSWTKLFQICFSPDPNADFSSFCPSVVWDLEADPSNGGYLPGDDGVVITVLDPDDPTRTSSNPAIENVEQYNWEYTGTGSSLPFGNSISTSCLEIDCGPLPIRLLSFDSRRAGRHSLLQWATAQEIGNDYFSVQRSKDGFHFDEIGLVDGGGNSNTELKYEFYDESPHSGINFYRLQQFDFDGKSDYSPIRTVVFSDVIEMSIYPNPAQDYLYVRTSSSETLTVGEMSYRIFDTEGLHRDAGVFNDPRQIIDVSHLASGVYYIEISQGALKQNFKFIRLD